MVGGLLSNASERARYVHVTTQAEVQRAARTSMHAMRAYTDNQYCTVLYRLGHTARAHSLSFWVTRASSAARASLWAWLVVPPTHPPF